MSLDFPFTCPLPNGMHARPASALEELARHFGSEVALLNQRTGRVANAKSILSIVGADIRFSDSCLLTVSGLDETPAMEQLEDFVRHALPGTDEELPARSAASNDVVLPPMLRQSGAVIRPGNPVVAGLALGRVAWAGGFGLPVGLATEGVEDIPAEQGRMAAALQQLIAWYDSQVSEAKQGIEGELLRAHRSVARDGEFRQLLMEAIAARRRTSAGAIADAEAHFTRMLAASENVLLRERVLDIRDVCYHLLQQLPGCAPRPGAVLLNEDTIVVAESLTPGQFLALDRQFLKGLALAQAGTTSHTVILARSFGIPTLVGVDLAAGAALAGQEAVVDGSLGALVTNLTPTVCRYYALERQRLAGRQQVLAQYAMQPAQLRDGQRIEVAANIATADEAELAFAAGAEGIGLFRTEMLYCDRAAVPSEEEQYEAYCRVLKAAAGRPVMIRTLDIGGDKPLPYLKLPGEPNPFLGSRAVRMYPAFEALFRAQIRALVRASAHGPLKILLPMITTVDEARWARRLITEEQVNLGAASGSRPVSVGAMIEVPAAAFTLDSLSHELDFFSVGSNDLLQNFLAVDRTNAAVASLYNPLQPAFLRLLKQVVDAAHAHRKWIGLCGEMGGQARLLPLLAGLRFDEISVASPTIAGVKAGLARLTLVDCQPLLAAAMNCATATEVVALLDKFPAQQRTPLFAPELVLVEADATTKEEAIKLAVDALFVTGRAEQPLAVEEAVWQREATYSTGFGHGFAIPHCKSSAVLANSLVFLKLRQPVVWGSLDGEPVRMVILLAIRESDGATEHMRVFSTLARQVMHESFRARLEQSADSQALCAVLAETLGV